jgi:hypothetical protein
MKKIPEVYISIILILAACYLKGQGKARRGYIDESAKVGDESYPDGLTASRALIKLRALTAKSQPFFAVGFFKTYLPFNAPKKYGDLYNECEITLTQSPAFPLNINPASCHQASEFNAISWEPKMLLCQNPFRCLFAETQASLSCKF